jgi:CO/xanthine dehydrogenase Mo-binding subunit
MSQQRKTKIEPKLESVVHIRQPVVRDFSTGGGHGPGDVIMEDGVNTKKWQGYVPENLNVIGKPMPPMPEVALARFLGKAEYTTRVRLPNMLYTKFLTCPHPRARIKQLDISAAQKMAGVACILTHETGLPATAFSGTNAVDSVMPQETAFQGEVVAMVAAETEDLAEDAVEAIRVEYEVLPFASTVKDAMAPNAPDLRMGRGNLIKRRSPTDPNYDPNATWAEKRGDVEKGFAEADVIKEFTYYFAGGVSIPMQPCGCVAKWDGDKLTLWGMGQGISPQRYDIARGLGIDVSKVRFINKYNGCTFGAARAGSQSFYVPIAQMAKITGRPVKLMLPKDQELAHIQIKPETLTKFKVGAKKDGRITAILHEVFVSVGPNETSGHAASPGHAANQTEIYTAEVPHFKSLWYAYKTNAIRTGASRSYFQQEAKWAWENMIDEMAEELQIDPVKFRLMHVSRPGHPLHPYDSFASIETLEEGAKVFGWEKRNPKAGSMPGRFKRGVGVGISQHHGGQIGYHEGEEYFEKLTAQNSTTNPNIFGTELELSADGNVTMKIALPDSGTNHATPLAQVVAEMLGYTTRDRMRVVWGDSDTSPSSGEWYAGRTVTLQGSSTCAAADKLRKDLLRRASTSLKVDAATLQIRDGVISAMDNPRKRVTFGELARANGGFIRQIGRGVAGGPRGAMNKGVGACFLEVEVDTWTGDWRLVRSVYCHDTGLVVNPLTAEADLHGSLIQSAQLTTDPIPWDREFPGTRHYSVGYLSYRLPTIMDVPEQQTQVFIDSLEPRWFYGIKGFSETAIGAVPGAISNAIYNACGVRIREHPVTKEKIMAGLKARGGTA